MRQWVIDQLRSEGLPPWIVIDSAGVATDEEIHVALATATAVHRVRDWAELRRAWEHHGRIRSDIRTPVVITVTDPRVRGAADIAWDIDLSATVLTVRVPGDYSVRDALLSLEPAPSDIAVARIQSSGGPDHDSVLTAAAGLPAIDLDESPSTQFRTALRLHQKRAPQQVMELARSTIVDPLAAAMLSEPIDANAIQNAWEDWVNNPAESRWAAHFEESGAEVAGLILNGTVQPVDAPTASLPAWARIGIRSNSLDDRVTTLLGSIPPDPTSFEEWARIAEWWGEVRSSLALINPPDMSQVTRAWEIWEHFDGTFRTWLADNYGTQLTRAWSGGPISLDKVQPFLASRMRDAGRILLIVLDGMGFAQWSLIRSQAHLRVIRASGVLAMIPTLTEVSRQAIAAGNLPTSFASSLTTTRKEPELWKLAWAGVAKAPSWMRIDGARINDLDQLPLGSSDAIGVVLSATDELMHSSALLGDVGLHASLQAWLQAGVLDALIARAAEHGYEMWITSDHGNLSCNSSPAPREGAFVERAGRRVRRYATNSLRNDGAAAGYRWDKIPGYPRTESERILFATGRSAWGESSVSHGGLSLDEVIVPLVQVDAK